MTRRATKIVATLGPASSDPAMLEALIRAGVDVVRLNFSHGTAQDHIDRARLVREAAQRAGREVAIMADLQGPKIRVGKFADGKAVIRFDNGGAPLAVAKRGGPVTAGGKSNSGCSCARPARTAENEGMGDAIIADGVLEGLDHLFLSQNLFKGLGSPFAG